MKSYAWDTALCGAESWTLQKINHKYLKSFETLLREGRR
jgi:hypothetical protein